MTYPHELAAHAQFLLDRLEEYDPEDEDHVRDFHGHVSPAIARLRAALAAAPAVGGEIIAWSYELAVSRYADTGVYANFRRHLSWDKPEVPEGSIRNLRPLYAAQPASPLRVTGAINQVEEAACLIWSELCPGLVMSDEDIPHYEAAAKAVLALSASPLRGRDRVLRKWQKELAEMEEMDERGDLTEYGQHSLRMTRRFVDDLTASAAPPEQPFIPGESIELAHRAQRERRAAEFASPVCNTSDDRDIKETKA